MEDDTVKLLRECSSGCKMAMDSISRTLSKTDDAALKKVLQNYYGRHVTLGDECKEMLASCGEPDRDVVKIAKVMSDVKTEFEFMIRDKPATAAKLMIDGCAMGIKSVGRYMNEYCAASEDSKELANRIIECEKDFSDAMIPFL